MPTENRSSNTEMVSVPRERLHQFIEYSASVCKSPAWVKDKAALLAALEQPAPQPHPDPIAWMVGTAFWWTKEEAERDAAATGLPIVGLGPMTGAANAEQHQGEPEACSHEWTDDGEFMLVCTACGAQENHDPKWRDMASAPRDGTLVRLLVNFTEHATEDEGFADIGSATIGSNSFKDTGEDIWQFAGWSWEQDCFTQGEGEPVGWLPMLDTPHVDLAEVERLRGWVSAYKESRERLHDWLREEKLKNISLRAQLAEAQALLEDWHTANCTGEVNVSDKSYRIVTRTAAMLSGNADLNTPVDRDDRSDIVADAAFRNGVMHGYKLAMEGDEAEYQACINNLTRHLHTARAALSASAEPSAPTWSCQSCQLEQPTDRPCDVCGGKTEPVATKP